MSRIRPSSSASSGAGMRQRRFRWGRLDRWDRLDRWERLDRLDRWGWARLDDPDTATLRGGGLGATVAGSAAAPSTSTSSAFAAAFARLASTRLVCCLTSVSRSFNCTASGVATKIDEYAPAAMPMNSASERSFSGPAPSTMVETARIAPTGSNAVIEVLIDRTNVWLTARLASSG